MWNRHAAAQSKCRAAANSAGWHAALSGNVRISDKRPSFGQTPDNITPFGG
jgi:hypothetical protein